MADLDKDYTVDEATQMLVKAASDKIAKFEATLRDLRSRELLKASPVDSKQRQVAEGMSRDAHQAHQASVVPEAPVKMPTPEEHATRQAGFSVGAGPVGSSGLELARSPKRVGVAEIRANASGVKKAEYEAKPEKRAPYEDEDEDEAKPEYRKQGPYKYVPKKLKGRINQAREEAHAADEMEARRNKLSLAEKESGAPLCKECGKAHSLEKGCDIVAKEEKSSTGFGKPGGKFGLFGKVPGAKLPPESPKKVNEPGSSAKEAGSGGKVVKGKSMVKTGLVADDAARATSMGKAGLAPAGPPKVQVAGAKPAAAPAAPPAAGGGMPKSPAMPKVAAKAEPDDKRKDFEDTGFAQREVARGRGMEKTAPLATGNGAGAGAPLAASAKPLSASTNPAKPENSVFAKGIRGGPGMATNGAPLGMGEKTPTHEVNVGERPHDKSKPYGPGHFPELDKKPEPVKKDEMVGAKRPGIFGRLQAASVGPKATLTHVPSNSAVKVTPILTERPTAKPGFESRQQTNPGTPPALTSTSVKTAGARPSAMPAGPTHANVVPFPKKQ